MQREIGTLKWAVDASPGVDIFSIQMNISMSMIEENI